MQTNFTYDADGIRTSKTAGGYRRDYVIQNGKVVRETMSLASTGTVLVVMDFIYDANGRPFAMKYRAGANGAPTTYYYVLNLQGDVVKLVKADGTPVAEYTYNAWGQILGGSGSMVNMNPLRYRGYYYDTETGYYYLQSRYYDPAIQRFINADSLASTGQGFVGTNMFAYCLNNPSRFVDSNGCSATLVLSGVTLQAFTTWLTTIAAVNWWNVVGWVAAGVLATGMIVGSAFFLYEWFVAENPGYAEIPESPDTEHGEVTSKDPPTEKDGYIAPKGGPRKGKTKDGKKKGWVDKNGNIWVPAPTGTPSAHGGGHWDVQSANGRGYSNVYPGGHVRSGAGSPPKIGKATHLIK